MSMFMTASLLKDDYGIAAAGTFDIRGREQMSNIRDRA